MITAKDLRIGNWINDPGENPMEIRQLDLSTYSQQSNIFVINFYKADDLSPIPLTPEILLKCGFEYIRGDQVYAKLTFNIGADGILIFAWHIKKQIFQYIDFNEYLIECKSLHQLQNLIFALTGEELTIKL